MQCINCGETVSDVAAECPHCGEDPREEVPLQVDRNLQVKPLPRGVLKITTKPVQQVGHTPSFAFRP